MAAGEDVTDIEWEPPPNDEGGLGEVTIEHRVVGDTKAPMKRDDARRLADRVFGDDKRELPLRGEGLHWVRSGLTAESSDTP
jgi:hypothetical protein